MAGNNPELGWGNQEKTKKRGEKEKEDNEMKMPEKLEAQE